MGDVSHGHRQSKLNTLILAALSGLLIVFIGLLGYLGKHFWEKQELIETNVAAIRASADVISLRVGNLEDKVRNFVTVDRLQGELALRDQEITELNKEINRLNRKFGTPAGDKP
jgi:hypothetical protein